MKKNNKKGFTLAELLIVVAIVAVLTAIAIPVFSAQLDRSKEAVDEANCRSAYGDAMATYLANQGTASASTSGTATVANITYTWSYDGSKMTVTGAASASGLKSDKYKASGISYDGTNFSFAATH